MRFAQMQNAKCRMQNFGRLRLAPLTLYSGGDTPPLLVSRFVCRRGGEFEVIGNSEEVIGR